MGRESLIYDLIFNFDKTVAHPDFWQSIGIALLILIIGLVSIHFIEKRWKKNNGEENDKSRIGNSYKKRN